MWIYFENNFCDWLKKSYPRTLGCIILSSWKTYDTPLQMPVYLYNILDECISCQFMIENRISRRPPL